MKKCTFCGSIEKDAPNETVDDRFLNPIKKNPVIFCIFFGLIIGFDILLTQSKLSNISALGTMFIVDSILLGFGYVLSHINSEGGF